MWKGQRWPFRSLSCLQSSCPPIPASASPDPACHLLKAGHFSDKRQGGGGGLFHYSKGPRKIKSGEIPKQGHKGWVYSQRLQTDAFLYPPSAACPCPTQLSPNHPAQHRTGHQAGGLGGLGKSGPARMLQVSGLSPGALASIPAGPRGQRGMSRGRARPMSPLGTPAGPQPRLDGEEDPGFSGWQRVLGEQEGKAQEEAWSP